MSIDYLLDLERAIDGGREVYACPGVARNQWHIERNIESLKNFAKRAADNRKRGVNIIRLIPKDDAIAGDLFLVPTRIGDLGVRGEAQIQWSTVETKEAAEMMRDVRFGPSPYFGMQNVTEVQPTEL